MPLDNAQFIAELSVTDPPGTDPLNQGDDHIRTTKLAVQQSFPNVGSAVPQTGAQMAQMAIKNEVNVYTQQQQFADGTALLPSITFASKTNLGMYKDGVDALGFAVAGSRVLGLDAVTSIWSVTQRGTDGLAIAPQYSFSSETGTGMFIVSAGNLAWAVGGVEKMRLTANHLLPSSTTVQIRAGFDGTEAQPLYSFNNETGMGMFRRSASVMAWAINGVERMSISNQLLGLSDIDQIRNVPGLQGIPSYSFQSFPTTGMWVSTGGDLEWSMAGVVAMFIRPNRRINMQALPTSASGLSRGDLYAKASSTLAKIPGLLTIKIEYCVSVCICSAPSFSTIFTLLELTKN